MRTVDIPISPAVRPDRVAAALEAACASSGLHATRTGTLKTIPGSIHWHFKQGKAAGVLELTWSPADRHAWLSIQDGRKAPWIDVLLPALLDRFREGLRTAGEEKAG